MSETYIQQDGTMSTKRTRSSKKDRVGEETSNNNDKVALTIFFSAAMMSVCCPFSNGHVFTCNPHYIGRKSGDYDC